MFDKIITQIEALLKPYQKDIRALQDTLGKTNELLTEVNKSLKENTEALKANKPFRPQAPL